MKPAYITLTLISLILSGCIATSSYEGETQNDMRQGKGSYVYPSGWKYVGDWLDNKRHGMGTQYEGSGGSKYIGEWKDDNKHGKGTYFFLSGGSKHVGEWRNGKRHGWGYTTSDNGTIVFSGIWENGQRTNKTLNPESTMYLNGGSYEGEVFEGKPKGEGVYTRKIDKHTQIKVYSDNWTGAGEATQVKIEVPGRSATEVYFYYASNLSNYLAGGTMRVAQGKRNSTSEPFKETPYYDNNTFQNASFSQDIRLVNALASSYKPEKLAKERIGYTGILDNLGRKQGPGKLVTPEKRVYLGSFKNDLFHGDHTRLYFANGWADANYFKGFKVGYGNTYTGGNEYKAMYDKGREIGWTVNSKTHYITTGNTSTSDHSTGYLRYISDGKVTKEYDISSPSKFTFCPISNLLWPKRIMVLGNSCENASVGFDPFLWKIFKNLKLKQNDNQTYLIQHGDLEPLINVGGSTVGTFRKGKADLIVYDYRNRNQIVYRGNALNNKKHGPGLCYFENNLEPCVHADGVRVDKTHQARLAIKKFEEEEVNRQASASKCQNNFDRVESGMNEMSRLGGPSCQSHINSMIDGLNTVVNRSDCAACGQRPFKQAGNSAYQCVVDNRKQLRRSASRTIGAVSNLSKWQCGNQNDLNQMKRSISQLKRDVATQLDSLDSSYRHLKSEYKRIIWPKLERIEDNNNAGWLKAIKSFENAAREIMAQKRQNHNIQLSLVRQQQQLQQSLKIQRRNYQSQAIIKPKSQAQINAIKKRIYPNIAAKKSCLSQGHSWKNDRCQIIQTIKFPGRVCYDPTGKSCKTGETVYYNKSTGNYDEKFQRSDVASGPNTHGPSSNNSGSAVTSSTATEKTEQKGALKVEGLAYCWQNKKKTSWLCHGTTQKTLIGSSLEKAIGYAGCPDGNRQRQFKGGLIFYCGFGMESYHEDVAAIYGVSESLLGGRNNYQCEKFKLTTCRDISSTN